MFNRKIPKFLKKLFSILDNQSYTLIISWDAIGENITIFDTQKLESQVIPCHFTLRKLSSFVRQLHLYNFHKKKSKKNYLVFCNELFKREYRNLAHFVVRKRKTKAQMDPQNETNTSEKGTQMQKSNYQPNHSNLLIELKDKSQDSLQLLDFNEYENLQIYNQDSYDILNLF